MRTKLFIATSASLLVLMTLLEAQAAIFCPPNTPFACYCQFVTGGAEVSRPSPASPLELIGLWSNLQEAARADWASEVAARQGTRRILSTRWQLACDQDQSCAVTRRLSGSSVIYRYSCYAKARPGPCGQRHC
jgi:hypothetical protein